MIRSVNKSFIVLLALVLTGCGVSRNPLTRTEIDQRVQNDLQNLFAEQEPINGKISLYEAFARAIKYNLDQRVKLMEDAVSRRDLDVAQIDMLPKMAINAGYTRRDTLPFSTSITQSTGKEGTDPSTSQERGRGYGDMTMVWNILDFGVSYVQTQQQADRTLLVREQRRKAVQNIIQDVRHAYWRAATAQHLLPEFEALLKETEEAMGRSRTMEEEQAMPPLEALTFQQGLLEVTRQLWNLHRDLVKAKSDLAALINLRPGTRFALESGREEELVMALGNFPLEALENYALAHRAELREEDYNQRILSLEARKILLGTLPGLEFSLGNQYDDTKYLVNQAWREAGMRISWGMLKWISAPYQLASVDAQKELSRTRRMAFSMAVLTQLHLALQAHGMTVRDLKIIRELNSVHHRKLKHATAATMAAKGNPMAEIRSKADALFARMQQGLAFAENQGAAGQVVLSLGIDPLPDEV
ncbi:MAG: TolC family protein, partial [Magnetococcales bacterium]|nr:TolC family protein [Magnetococcales bacterium]